MPFPLLSLPYGFRRRLVELSTPFEAYSIQVAAPYVIPFCQPVKMTKMYDWDTNRLKLDGCNNQFYDESDNHVTLGEYELRSLACGLIVNNLPNMDNVFDHLILSQSAMVSFTDCHIDFAFVKKLRSNLSIILSKKPNYFYPLLDLENCTYDSNTTKTAIYELIFNHFAHVRWRPLPRLAEGINGLLNSNITGLYQFELALTALNMLDIDPNILLKFFLAQNDRFEFEMRLYYVNEPDAEIQEKVDAMLSKNFKLAPYIHIPWHLKDPEPKLIRYLRIYYSDKRLRYELITDFLGKP